MLKVKIGNNREGYLKKILITCPICGYEEYFFSIVFTVCDQCLNQWGNINSLIKYRRSRILYYKGKGA